MEKERVKASRLKVGDEIQWGASWGWIVRSVKMIGGIDGIINIEFSNGREGRIVHFEPNDLRNRRLRAERKDHPKPCRAPCRDSDCECIFDEVG